MSKETIIKYYNNQPITEQEIVDLLINHYHRTENITLSGEVLSQLLIRIKQGMLSLDPILKWELQQYPKIQLDILYNKQGQPIYRKIYEINLEK